MKKVKRYFLDYQISLKDQAIEIEHQVSFEIYLNNKKNYEINKFFYKQIGKDHRWIDRLSWNEQNWIAYVEDKKSKLMF